MSDGNFKWWYANHEDPDVWQGPSDSRADAISEGQSEYPGETIWICEADKMSLNCDDLFDHYPEEDLAPEIFEVTFDLVSELFDGQNEECWGEDGPEYIDATASAEEELMSALRTAQALPEGRAEAMSKAFEDWCAVNRAALPTPWFFGTTRNEEQILPPRNTYPDTLATPEELQAWAAGIMAREPDAIIGDNQMRRWWVIPRNMGLNVYLHEILKSDDARALHDHPSDNMTMVIEGSYIEHTPEGAVTRSGGDIVERKATDAHRLEIPEGGRAVSLFLTGPKIREWGFLCEQGWRAASLFVSPLDGGQVGRGCE